MKSTAAREQLWDDLSLLFEADDGSLPEVRLVNVSPPGAAGICEALRSRAEPLLAGQTVWHHEREQEVPLNEIPDAGTLAAEGKLSSLHVVLQGIESHGVRVPDLGMSVWPGQVALDYRMGEAWSQDTLAAFVELLGDLLQLDPTARLDVEEFVLADVRDRFRRAVSAYLAAPHQR
jgi:hypothetical protein